VSIFPLSGPEGPLNVLIVSEDIKNSLHLVKHQQELDVTKSLSLLILMRKQGREGITDVIMVIDPLNTASHDRTISPTDNPPLRVELESIEPLLGEVASVIPCSSLSHGFDVLADNHVPVDCFEYLLVDTLHSEAICELLLDFLFFTPQLVDFEASEHFWSMLPSELPMKSNGQEPESLGLLHLVGKTEQRSLIQVPAAVFKGTRLVQPPPLQQASGEQ
jgi:hypothetical protein